MCYESIKSSASNCPLKCLLAPRSVQGADDRVFVQNNVVNIGSFHIAPTQSIAVIADKMKHKHIQKESPFPLPLVTSLSGLHCSSGPLKEPSVDGTGRASGHVLQKEGDLDRRLQLRLGGAVRWQTGLRPLVEEGRLPSHQLPGNSGSVFGPT